jgi:hypothetical protein
MNRRTLRAAAPAAFAAGLAVAAIAQAWPARGDPHTNDATKGLGAANRTRYPHTAVDALMIRPAG